jgi:hypothetical protein
MAKITGRFLGEWLSLRLGLLVFLYPSQHKRVAGGPPVVPQEDFSSSLYRSRNKWATPEESGDREIAVIARHRKSKSHPPIILSHPRILGYHGEGISREYGNATTGQEENYGGRGSRAAGGCFRKASVSPQARRT